MSSCWHPLACPRALPFSGNATSRPLSPPPLSPVSSAPFKWIHFERRSVKTTLNTIQGVDTLARERRWRSQCIFSIDVGCHVKQGVGAVGAFLCLQVERIQLISRGRSLPPTSTWSSSTEPTLEHNPPMPMHHGPFPRAQAYRAATCATHRLLGRRRRRSVVRPNPRVISLLRGGRCPPRSRLPPRLHPSLPPLMPPRPAHARAVAPKRRRACAPGAVSGPRGTIAVTRAASPLLHLASPQADDPG